MKKLLILVVAIAGIVGFSGCSSDNFNNNNPYLPGYSFTLTVDMTLPSYTDLLYTGNAKYIGIDGIGINGIFVMNTGSGWAAWEASCPNQELSSCSVLEKNGVNVKCPCDGVEYSLFTGQPTTPVKYPLKSYRVEILGNNAIRVYN